MPAHSLGAIICKSATLQQRLVEFEPRSSLSTNLLCAWRNGKDEAARVLPADRIAAKIWRGRWSAGLSRVLVVHGGAHSGGAGQTALGHGGLMIRAREQLNEMLRRTAGLPNMASHQALLEAERAKGDTSHEGEDDDQTTPL